MALLEILEQLTDHDVAVLADWASRRKISASDNEVKRAYSLLREGADLLLRQRALSAKLKQGENNGANTR